MKYLTFGRTRESAPIVATKKDGSPYFGRGRKGWRIDIADRLMIFWQGKKKYWTPKDKQ